MKITVLLSLLIFNIFIAAAATYLLHWDKPSAMRNIKIKECIYKLS